jgi:hypothetical protein
MRRRSFVSIDPRRTAGAPLAIVLVASSLAASACGGSSPKSSASKGATSANTTKRVAGSNKGATGAGSVSGAANGSRQGGTSAPAGAAGSGNASNGSSSGHPTAGKSASHEPSSSANNTSAGRYSPQLRSAILTFYTCVREHGVKLAPPNFAGKPSEILSSKGVDTKSSQFQSAMNGCSSDLIAILRAGGASLPGATR